MCTDHRASPLRCNAQPIQPSNNHARTCSTPRPRRHSAEHRQAPTPAESVQNTVMSALSPAMDDRDGVEGQHHKDIAESAVPQRPRRGQKALLIRAILRSEEGWHNRRRNSTCIRCRTRTGRSDFCGHDGARLHLQPARPVGAPAPTGRNASKRRNGTGTEKCRPFRFAHATLARRDNLPRTSGDNLRGHP